jgi:hypothetical protein
VSRMAVSASGGVPMPRSTRYVAVLACTAAVAATATAVALRRRCGGRRDRGEEAAHPAARRTRSAAARRPRASTCVRSSRMPRPGLLGMAKNGNWNSRQRRSHRLEAIRHGTKGLVIPVVRMDS